MKETETIRYLGDYIDGRFHLVDQADGEIKDQSPCDLSDTVIQVKFHRDRVDQSCTAAKAAFYSWSHLTQDQRVQYLLRLKEVYVTHAEEMAKIIARDSGKPLWEGLNEAKGLAAKIDITLSHSARLVKEEHVANALPNVDGYVRYKARGVMAVVGPFNFPAHLPNGHIIPALYMGNTVVFKPSEQTPAVGQFMAQMFEKAEFPPGVFNMVQGDGEAGRKLVGNEHVDGVLFTGSYEVGLRIKQETLTHYWKILALEMGGKNSTVIWNDADQEKAIYESLLGCFMTSGQRCSCTSRLFVHDKIADEFIENFYQAAKKLSIGHWSENPFMGPLINQGAVEKYIRFQEMANREGNESLMRGKTMDLKWKGHYVTPSIHVVKSWDPNSVYQKSEIFGPNVAIYRVTDFDETLKIINSTGYGLSMAIFSKADTLYKKALIDAKVGLLNWNRTTNGSSSKLPFGGMGKSGNDRPSADFAIQYCAVPVASLEDQTPFDRENMVPGVQL